MMQSLPQSYSPHPGAMQQHPGMAQGHQMIQTPGHPGPGMPQQMHMGVSGPGPQVAQGGAMMAGMPPGAGGPSAHALSHLNPQQQQMFQHQQQAAMFASNPQLQQMHQQQQMIAQQRAQQAQRQAMLVNQYGGTMPVTMPNGMQPQMTPAQFNAMRGGQMARPMNVNLPQHLQQQQQQLSQQAEHSLQQQAQAHAQQQHQQQVMMAQQLAMQQQAQAQAGNNQQGQPGQINAQQPPNMQQAAMMQQQAQQQQQAQAAAASQQNQTQPQSQPQPQQTPQNPQAQPQPAQPAQQAGGMNQAQVAAAMMQQQQQQHQQRSGEKLKGHCLLKLMQFGDHLSFFSGAKHKDDLQYWLSFVNTFFSPKGVLRHSVWLLDEQTKQYEIKQYEITYPALPRYFHTHFESGVKQMQLMVEKSSEKELPGNNHYIESQKSSFIYWFDNGSQLIASGTLKAHFDATEKIELLEFITSSHEEYLPRNKVTESVEPWKEWKKDWQRVNAEKPSPEMNKKGKVKPMKSPAQPPPDIDFPASKVKKGMGITPSVFRFLENPPLAPYSALEQYVANVNGANQQNPNGPRTPGMNNFAVGASPAQAHMNLPGGSPHIGSPAQAPGMQHQQSQHGTSSSGPSANTSPNASNKRRRPSTVKTEDEIQVNGTQTKPGIKPSPRIGGKRQKGHPA